MQDMISNLPTEIALLIFKFVGLKDSYKCLSVCKSWRDILNCPYLWNYFYQIYDLEQIGGSEGLLDRRNFGKALSPLCPQAIDVQKFLGSPAFNWRTGKLLDFYFHLSYRVWSIACQEPYFTIFYSQRNEIQIYCCLEHECRLVDTITISFNITIRDNSQTMIKISPKYFLLGFYNLTLIFKLTSGKFMFYRVCSMEENLEVVCSDKSFDIFVEQHCRKDEVDYERYLVDDVLWLTNGTSLKQIINLSNREVKSILIPYKFTKEIKQPYLIHHSNKSVLITNSNGTEVSSFSIPYAKKVFYMNTHFVLVHFLNDIEDKKDRIECRLIKTGELLNTTLVRKHTKAIMHPKKDIIYLLSTVNEYFSLISLCARTGTRIWSFKEKISYCISWSSFIYLINERFIFTYPAPSSELNFALFSLSGKLIHEGLYTDGMMIYFSSSFFIAKEFGHFHVYCYS